MAVLIEYGQLCKGKCGPGSKQCPSPREPALIECPTCNGMGCDECDDGEVSLASCAKRYVGAGMSDLMQLFALYDKGHPPVSGGVLDQSQWFINAYSFASNERAFWKNKLGYL